MKHLKLFEEFNPDDVIDNVMNGIDKAKVFFQSPSIRRIIGIVQNDPIISYYINNDVKFEFAEEVAYNGYDQTAKCIVNRRLKEILSNRDYYLFANNSDYVNRHLNLHVSPNQAI